MTPRSGHLSPPGQGVWGAVDASMNLLNEVMRNPLDPSYREATERHRAAGAPPLGRRRRAWLFALAIGLGLLTSSAAADLRAPEPAVAQARTLLERQIGERTRVADNLQRANERSSQEISKLQTAAIGNRNPALLARLAADGVNSGAVAVRGTGLRITLHDSAAARESPESANPDERVQDVDLQIAVNGLWASGAEAIAINGHRLTAVTAIRSAGSAILVDLIPLSGPYVVEAIGDPDTLATNFAKTAAGQHLATLRNTYGIGTAITSQDALDLAGSAATRLWSATIAPGGDVASSGPTSERDSP